jgi:hypothetical protein
MLKQEFQKLTIPEQKAYYLLYKVDDSDGNPWKIKIRKITRGGTAEDFKNLLSELESEGSANPPVMQSIIGAVEWFAVETIFCRTV